MSLVARVSLVAVALAVSIAGCGWLGASGVPHNKPDAFVLRGHVAVPVAAADPRPDGAACASTLPDIVTGSPVRITDSTGKLLATGSLGDGVIAREPTGSTCDFPFQIAGVAGGVATYDVAVGTRPAQRFPAKDLRENAAAIITLTA